MAHMTAHTCAGPCARRLAPAVRQYAELASAWRKRDHGNVFLAAWTGRVMCEECWRDSGELIVSEPLSTCVECGARAEWRQLVGGWCKVRARGVHTVTLPVYGPTALCEPCYVHALSGTQGTLF